MAVVKYLLCVLLALFVAAAGVLVHQRHSAQNFSCRGHINKQFDTAEGTLVLEGTITLVFLSSEKGDARFSGWLSDEKRHYRVDRLIPFSLTNEHTAGFWLAKSAGLEKAPADEAPGPLMDKISLLSRSQSFIEMHQLNHALVMSDGLAPFLYCVPAHQS